MKRLIAAIALACLFAGHANAAPCQTDNNGRTVCMNVRGDGARVSYRGDATIIGGRPAGCPHAYCGCGTSLKVFGRIVPELNLAYNWVRKFPRAYPAAGMVAANRHHVFYIQSVNGDGTVVAYDPNSGGHKTRIHTVSLRGYVVVDPHGSKVASR